MSDLEGLSQFDMLYLKVKKVSVIRKSKIKCAAVQLSFNHYQCLINHTEKKEVFV